jgi:hypothetical protein
VFDLHINYVMYNSIVRWNWCVLLELYIVTHTENGWHEFLEDSHPIDMEELVKFYRDKCWQILVNMLKICLACEPIRDFKRIKR